MFQKIYQYRHWRKFLKHAKNIEKQKYLLDENMFVFEAVQNVKLITVPWLKIEFHN